MGGDEISWFHVTKRNLRKKIVMMQRNDKKDKVMENFRKCATFHIIFLKIDGATRISTFLHNLLNFFMSLLIFFLI